MGLGAKVVIALAKSIKQKPYSILYFDNFFTSIELMHHLRNEYVIFSLGTVRANRLRGQRKNLLVALYRTDWKGHRWYLVLFSQILDISVNNAWLLYRHENSGKQKLLPLKKFRVALFRQLRFLERSSNVKK